MALTLPDDWQQFSPEALQLAVKKLGERFAKRCSVREGWHSLALAWKKEPQKRGALHWHLLFYGIEEDAVLGTEVHLWFARQWNELICSKLDPAERSKHLSWHSHANNWQRVEHIAYFTKYVGKCDDAINEEGSSGRWWGFWRKDHLPKATKIEGTIPDKVNVDMNRAARKMRQKQVDRAKQYVIAKKLSCKTSPFSDWKNGNPQPLSSWDLYRINAGYGPSGKGDLDAVYWKKHLHDLQKSTGVRFGKFKFKTKGNQPHPDELKITLTGKAMPETFKRLALWSAARHGFKI